MLVQCDPMELGDKRLSPEEAVCKERESLLNITATRKIDGQAELADVQRSMGPRLSWQEVISRLRRCNPNLLFTDAQGGSTIAVYRPKRRDELEEYEPDPTRPEWWNGHSYIGGFPKENLPEYSHVILDTSNLPVSEIRGWRSVLMRIIKARGITYSAAVNQFGEALGQRSGRWHEQLKQYKENYV